MSPTVDLEPHLRTTRLARQVEIHRTLPSTNDRALELARTGAPSGTLVVALEQTAGRGQRGRRWYSPSGAGLYASFVLRPRLTARLAPSLTLVAGVALRRALQPILPIRLGLRWPNDVLVAEAAHRGQKLAGILLEASADQDRIAHAVVGVGVNLSATLLTPELDAYTTSLEALGARDVELAPVLGRIANELEDAVRSVETEGLAPTAAEWSQHAIGLGERVRLDDGSEKHTGRLVGIAEDGALVLAIGSGERRVYWGSLDIPGLPRAPATTFG